MAGQNSLSLSKELSPRDGCVFELERISSSRFIALAGYSPEGHYLEMAQHVAHILRELLVQSQRDIGYDNMYPISVRVK
jgi:hypothetical protein